MVAFERVEADGVGEVRREQLVGLGFHPGSVRGAVRQLLIVPCVALVECRVNLGRDTLVSGVADRDAHVGVRSGTFINSNWHSSPRATCFLSGSLGADEVV
ncbi:hypothetical protein ACXZ66_11445 [Corynebacterium sp. S7]